MVEFDRLPPSGINVIIVGAGFGGLTAAIECDRKGHHVTLFEKFPEIKPLGDVISFGQNAGRIFAKWPGVMEQFAPIIHKGESITFHHWQGKHVTTQSFAPEETWGQKVNGHRAELHEIVFEHAKKRGIDIRIGHNVTDYFENDEEVGVIANGQKYTADVVIAAEGVKSAGRKIVLGFDDKPQASGYAIYRAWFSTEKLKHNPLTQRFMQEDSLNGWIGQDIHFLVTVVKDGAEMSWVCTHKDEAGIEESWQFPGKIEDVLKVLDGWAPEILEMVKATPKDRLFDYKLVFRDPVPTFVSPGRRTILIGDAAHPFLPTSIQGASQAMEDGVVVASCLDIAGKENVKEAMLMYEKIRYERVHKIQATGVSTREQWHKADWDIINKNPKLLHLQREAWILKFDAEEDVYSRYDKLRASLNGALNGATPSERVQG